MRLDKLVKTAVDALDDIKGRDIAVLDVRKLTSLFDWIVIASADSARQTKALARHVADTLREAGSAIIGTEGEDGAEWVLVDAGDVVAHVMQPAIRSHYNLEELWIDGRFDELVNSTVPPASRLQGRAAPVRKPRAKAAPAARKPRAKAAPAAKKPRAPARRPRAA